MQTLKQLKALLIALTIWYVHKFTDQIEEHFDPLTSEWYRWFRQCACRIEESSAYWRTTTTGKASKIKQKPLDKHNSRGKGLSVLYADDNVTKMSGNGHLCGEMKNLNKWGTEGRSWDLKTLISLLCSQPQVQLRVLRTKIGRDGG